MSEFSKKVTLVTGAGRGIGRAIAIAFAEHGAILAVNDLTPVNLAGTLAQIRSAGGQSKEYIYDIAKQMPVEAMVAEVLEDWGRLDILINNAGVHPVAPLLDMDEWDLRRTLDVNLCGPFFAIQQAGRAMRKQGGGVIVNIAASAESLQTWPDSAAFSASKMGLLGLTRVAARELAPDHIRVNAICPTWVDTEGATAAIAPAKPAERPRRSLSGNPSRPEAVAEWALFLCSLTAGDMTGAAIDLDGRPVVF